MINPTFSNINKLLVLSFKNADNDPTIDSLNKHYMPLVEIKDSNTLIWVVVRVNFTLLLAFP